MEIFHTLVSYGHRYNQSLLRVSNYDFVLGIRRGNLLLIVYYKSQILAVNFVTFAQNHLQISQMHFTNLRNIESKNREHYSSTLICSMLLIECDRSMALFVFFSSIFMYSKSGFCVCFFALWFTEYDAHRQCEKGNHKISMEFEMNMTQMTHPDDHI